MRIAAIGSVVIALAVGASHAAAGELKSGPQVGDFLGAYEVVKVAGAANDGVDEGQQLCYRCKLGNRPVVMVFAHQADEKLAALVKELDQVVAENKDKKMASFVSLLGDDVDALRERAQQFVRDNHVENVAFVVPQEHQQGPAEYKINPQADVTVLIYKEGTVVANHSLTEDQLTATEVRKIVKDTAKILQ